MARRFKTSAQARSWISVVGLIVLMSIALFPEETLAAKSPVLKIGVAKWAKGQLVVQGAYKNGSATAVELYDAGGRLLGTAPLKKQRFKFVLASPNRPELLCSVRAQADGLDTVKPVRRAAADCRKVPSCKILSPASAIAVSANTDVSFSAQATFNDVTATPHKLEWDFGGGAMGQVIAGSKPPAYKRPDTPETTVQFVRDNAAYKVRFTAWDGKNRYCEDSVLVTVGNPPTALPDVTPLAKQAQQSAPKAGSELNGEKGDLVVLPFADLTMPGTSDMRLVPNAEVVTAYTAFSTLHSVVYRKDRLPVVLDHNAAAVQYQAASNPLDPVAVDSINATSQNWPLAGALNQSSPLQGALIAKTDMWEVYQRPAADPRAEGYYNQNWVSQVPHYDGPDVGPDEGYRVASLPGVFDVPEGTQGRYMPGRDSPFGANQPQNFTAFDPAAQTHIARAIPLTDIDDTGRVNPFPLMRVNAADRVSGQTASSETVVASARDFHCRECHAKGKIGANDQFDWNSIPQAFHSGQFYGSIFAKGGSGCWAPEPFCSTNFGPPKFFDAADRNGQPSSNIFDQEFAANLNIGSLHDFYDWTEESAAHQGGQSANGDGYTWDAPSPCSNCHRSRISAEVGDPWVWTFTGYRGADQPTDSVGTLSEVMHNFHEQLQRDPGNPDRILRDGKGRPKLWDPATGANPNTLFPTVDTQGNALPMEQNCLRCHGGHREPLYRDRMYTAGVTCYDCHGEMSAVGSAHVKAKPGTGGDRTRLGWYEQPDCGSCHVGNGNLGKDLQSDFFSAGVMKRAFDRADRTATPRKPLTTRFAVQLSAPFTMPGIDTDVLDETDFRYRDKPYFRTIQVPLYRTSRDTHGNVPCAACHGGAHEVWPNRDPKANDNLTALQLQGHSGNILECNVCHTADSFKLEADLDGGTYSGDAQPGILGGPHNLHPVNDPFWWKSTEGDSANADGTTYGGWHNNYAKKPGALGEDQCSACHGNDHKGTRLSKTPVDRVFDFRGLNKAKLKKAGFKSLVVKVPAGTEIGCETCHSIKTSCTGSPAGGQCGVDSTFVPRQENHDPVITSIPGATEAVLGEAYSYQVTATDPDGDPLTYFLGYRPQHGFNPNERETMRINNMGLVNYDWPDVAFSASPHGPFVFPYTVTVTDGKGGYTTQTVTMTLRCPDGKQWQWDADNFVGACQAGQ